MARQMKDSGIEWIGEIPEEWEISRVKYVAQFEPACDTTCLNENSVITYTPMDCIKNGWFINNTATLGTVSNSLTPYQNGDVVMAKVTPCFENGNIAIMENLASGFGLGSSELFVFRPVSIHTRYFLYWLQNPMYVQMACSTMTGTGGLKRVSPYFAKNCYIHFPPLSEQQRIADFLDRKCAEIDAVIEHTKTTIEEYKKLKQAVITEAVTKGVRGPRPMKNSGIEWIGEIPEEWRTAPLKAFIDILPGYAFSSDDFSTENGIPLLRGINVAPNIIRWDETVRYNLPITEQLTQFQLQEGDIVVGLDRPWISDGTRIAWVTKDDVPSLLLQRVCRIRAKEGIDLRWVYHWIASNAFQESLSTETTGVSVPHISTKQIGNFVIALPSYEEQSKACDFLDEKCAALDTLIAKKTTLLTELETYKKSLIYEYVTGKKEV